MVFGQALRDLVLPLTLISGARATSLSHYILAPTSLSQRTLPLSL